MRGLDPVSDAWCVAYCAHCYYHTDIDSPMDDQAYDQLVRIVSLNWSDLTDELRQLFQSPKDMNTTTMQVRLTDEQFNRAKILAGL